MSTDRKVGYYKDGFVFSYYLISLIFPLSWKLHSYKERYKTLFVSLLPAASGYNRKGHDLQTGKRAVLKYLPATSC